MKHRSIGKMFFLFLLTVGFYRLYWLAKTKRELQEKSKLSIPSIWWLLLPYVLISISFGFFVASSVKSIPANDFEKRTCESRNYSYQNECVDETVDETDLNGYDITGMAILYFSLIVVFPLLGWWYWKYAQAVEQITHEKLSFPITMLIMLAVPDIFDMLIIQESFNKLGESNPA